MGEHVGLTVPLTKKLSLSVPTTPGRSKSKVPRESLNGLTPLAVTPVRPAQPPIQPLFCRRRERRERERVRVRESVKRKKKKTGSHRTYIHIHTYYIPPPSLSTPLHPTSHHPTALREVRKKERKKRKRNKTSPLGHHCLLRALLPCKSLRPAAPFVNSTFALPLLDFSPPSLSSNLHPPSLTHSLTHSSHTPPTLPYLHPFSPPPLAQPLLLGSSRNSFPPFPYSSSLLLLAPTIHGSPCVSFASLTTGRSCSKAQLELHDISF